MPSVLSGYYFFFLFLRVITISLHPLTSFSITLSFLLSHIQPVFLCSLQAWFSRRCWVSSHPARQAAPRPTPRSSPAPVRSASGPVLRAPSSRYGSGLMSGVFISSSRSCFLSSSLHYIQYYTVSLLYSSPHLHQSSLIFLDSLLKASFLILNVLIGSGRRWSDPPRHDGDPNTDSADGTNGKDDTEDSPSGSAR